MSLAFQRCVSQSSETRCFCPYEAGPRRGKVAQRRATVAAAISSLPKREAGEKHKIFDSVSIECESGRGGNGEIAVQGQGKWVKNFKYNHNSGAKKTIWLPASEPADGQHGSDVLLVADPTVSDLLYLHERQKWVAPRGANGNPAEGTLGPKRRTRYQTSGPALKVPVPMGTLVKDKHGKKIGELIVQGDVFCICQGGYGGRGTLVPSEESKPPRKQNKKLQEEEIEIVEVEDVNWKEDAQGSAGERKQITLQLQVVADVGIVGLPNVGKSTLLRRMTRSEATVANYPFTTLMPNLGVLTTDQFSRDAKQAPVLVDLPGLIEGAHTGRGLGRMFLRHLARTRVVVHVLDAAAEDPATDYWVVREELRMFNPEYCSRPTVVVLNKMDLPDASELKEEVLHEVQAMAERLENSHPGIHTQPVDVLCCSAQHSIGTDKLAEIIRNMLSFDEPGYDDDIIDWDTSLPDVSKHDRF